MWQTLASITDGGAKRVKVIGGAVSDAVTNEDASEQLGIYVRQVTRLKARLPGTKLRGWYMETLSGSRRQNRGAL